MLLHSVSSRTQAAAHVEDGNFARTFSLGSESRLSVSTLLRLFRTYQGKGIRDFVHMLVESCTVGQHFATAASRLEADKNKYRFVPSDAGLKPLISRQQLLAAGVTADRLHTALRLMVDCGLQTRGAGGDSFKVPAQYVAV
jgi:hypothetical protein